MMHTMIPETLVLAYAYEGGSINVNKSHYITVSGTISDTIGTYGTGESVDPYAGNIYGGGFDLFAVSDVGGDNEDVVINLINISKNWFYARCR